MGRTLSLGQKMLRIIVALALVIAVGGAGVYGVSKLLGNKGNEPAPKQEALDGLTDGTATTPEPDEDDLTVKLSRAEADAKYGSLKSKYVLQSSFLNMGKIRSKLTGFEDAVSIPFAAEQEWIDDQRRSAMTETMLNQVLSDKLKEWDAEFSKLTGDELEVAVRDRVKNEIMRSPIFADMVGRAFLTYPAVKAQNPWLVEFIKNMDESYARAEDEIDDETQLIGLEAWVHFESKEAKEANDLSKLVINDADNEKTGAFDLFYPAAQLAEMFDQFFSFEGKKSLMSANNWHLTLNSDHATQRTSEADYQENRDAYVFVHRTKMGVASVRIGFNTMDRRIELYKEVAKTTPKDTPEPAKPTPNPGDGKVKLTINYVYQDGSEAAKSFVGYYAKGDFYSVASPTANKQGFKPDRATVSGGPIVKDTTEKVTYYAQDVVLHNATINYLYRETGKAAAASFSKSMKDGESFTRTSPVIGGYTADKPEVTITMKGADVVVNVYYDKNKTREDDPSYTLTIVYNYSDGGTAAPTYTAKHKAGENYSVNSPSVKDATPNRSVVSGTMPGYDKTETVIYTKNGPGPGPSEKKYNLTLNCVDSNTGYVLQSSNQGQYAAGASFTVYAPSIAGYTANQSSVSGTMPASDHTVTISYTRIKDGDGTKKPEADPENAPGYNPGIGDNKPEDGPGQNESEKPPVNDHDNTPPSTPGMPGGDNRNDDGQDPSKPVTNPIVDDADNAPAQDITNPNNTGDASDSKNNGVIDLDDPVTTKPRSEYNPPASGAQQAAPVPATEKVYFPPVEPDPTPQPAAATPAPASTPAPQQDNSPAGQYEEPELAPLTDAVDAFSAPAAAAYTAAPTSEPAAVAEPAAQSVEEPEAAPEAVDYNAGAGVTSGGAGDFEE